MGKPDTQARHGHAAGTKGEPAQPHGEAAGGPEDLKPFAAPGVGADATGEAEGQGGDGTGSAPTAADWGLGEAKGRFSKETMIGVALVAVLLCAFGFVVYKKVDQRRQDAELLAKSLKSNAAREQGAPEPVEHPPTTGGRSNPPSRELPRPTGFDPVSQTGSADPFATASFESIAAGHAPRQWEPYQTATNDLPMQGEPTGFGGEPLPEPQPASAVAQPQDDPFATGSVAWDQAATADSSDAATVNTAADPFPTQDDPFAQGLPATTAEASAAVSADPFATAPPATAQAEPAPSAELGQSAAGTGSLPDGFVPPVEAAPTAGVHPLEPNPLPSETTVGGWDAAGATAQHAATTVMRPDASAIVDIGTSQPIQCAGQTTSPPQADPFAGSYAPVPSPEPAPSPDPIPVTRGGLAPPSADGAGIYEVRPQDSFWGISRSQYGTARYYVALARYNAERIPDAGKMRPGMKVLIPPREVLEARYPEASGKRTPAGAAEGLPAGFYVGSGGEPLYRVGPRDTLGDIARQHLGRSSRWTHIYQMNRDVLTSPNDLTIGTTLRLPADASRVRTASNPHEDW